MKQVTLIALYGDKPKDLELVIKKCWDLIQQSKLHKVFKSYDIRQIHSTLIGLEKHMGFSVPFNVNYSRNHGNIAAMDFDCLLQSVKANLPIQVRIGGFSHLYSEFKSKDSLPYIRSFQIQWENKKVVLIGWPFRRKEGKDDFISRKILWDLRSGLERQCYIQHKYPNDNDLFMVIGEITGFENCSDEELGELKAQCDQVEGAVREFLSQTPIKITIGEENTFVAQYVEETLPLSSTNVYCIQDQSVTGDFISGLY